MKEGDGARADTDAQGQPHVRRRLKIVQPLMCPHPAVGGSLGRRRQVVLSRGPQSEQGVTRELDHIAAVLANEVDEPPEIDVQAMRELLCS